jgi:antirestriction protein ArdC
MWPGGHDHVVNSIRGSRLYQDQRRPRASEGSRGSTRSKYPMALGRRFTSLHECGHWTGAKSRLDRDLKSRFNEKAYAAEELIAELNAAFLCAHLGITGQLRHADYIASWISLLREDDRAIYTAASQASKAADYLRSFSEVLQEEAP